MVYCVILVIIPAAALTWGDKIGVQPIKGMPIGPQLHQMVLFVLIIMQDIMLRHNLLR